MIPTKNLFLISLLFICGTANGQIITTIAGIDTSYGYSGDGGQATAAQLNYPLSARPDGAGNVYIADNSNHIRKISTAGIITTIAGNGSAIHSGDGGAATAAGIANPRSVFIDNAGNIFVAEDTSGGSGPWIRKINPAGIITTFAGGSTGYSGDNGPVTAAGFQYISDVVVDGGGNVYIGDFYNNRVRKVNAAGIITTIAGNGISGYSGDEGQATSAELDHPSGVAVDGTGNIYIADDFNARIRKINTSGVITTIAGYGFDGYTGDGGQATASAINNPHGIAIDGAGNVYIADDLNSRVRKVNVFGIITTIAGTGFPSYSGDGGLATASELRNPFWVAVDGTGNIYITDIVTDNIRKISADTTLNVPGISNKAQAMHTYPNPNDGTFIINISSTTTETAQIIITNLIGQKIKEITTVTNKEIETTLDAPPGMYFITTITAQGMQTGKIIVR